MNNGAGCIGDYVYTAYIVYNSSEDWISAENITVNVIADLEYNAGQYVELNPGLPFFASLVDVIFVREERKIDQRLFANFAILISGVLTRSMAAKMINLH